MALYSSEVVFQTPTIIDTLGIPDGRVSGREALREHFARGLARLPELRFELERCTPACARWRSSTAGTTGRRCASCTSTTGSGLIERVQALYERLDW